MTIHHQSHRERISAGLGFEWDLLPQIFDDASQIPEGATEVRLRRIGKSHRGVAKLLSIKRLWAYSVDQEFLSEICQLQSLEGLYLEKVTASDLSGVCALTRLTRLSVIDATKKVQDLSWVPTHSTLRSFGIENLSAVHDLAPLSRLTQLEALSVEGSMWTPMRVSTLAPLSALSCLGSLFITNLRAADQSLQALHGLRRLAVLQCAKFFPQDEFRSLAAAQPQLRCDWFDEHYGRKLP